MNTPRSVVLSLTTALMAAACVPQEQVVLRHRSTMEVQARGVVTSDDGQAGMLGMGNMAMACDFSTKSGLQDDWDLPEDGMVVDGAQEDIVGMSFVAISEDVVHVLEPAGPVEDEAIPMPGVITAGALPGGFVVLGDSGGCELTWYDRGGVAQSTDVSVCGGSPTVVTDKETGDVYVANGGPIVVSDGDDTTVFDTSGDLIAWDAHADVLYTAQRGQSFVSALEPDGTPRWTVDLDGSVVSITSLGSFEAVGVMVENENGTGRFVALDARNGAVRTDVATPSAAQNLTASFDGSVVGMVLDFQVHWYDLSEELAP